MPTALPSRPRAVHLGGGAGEGMLTEGHRPGEKSPHLQVQRVQVPRESWEHLTLGASEKFWGRRPKALGPSKEL